MRGIGRPGGRVGRGGGGDRSCSTPPAVLHDRSWVRFVCMIPRLCDAYPPDFTNSIWPTTIDILLWCCCRDTWSGSLLGAEYRIPPRGVSNQCGAAGGGASCIVHALVPAHLRTISSRACTLPTHRDHDTRALLSILRILLLE